MPGVAIAPWPTAPLDELALLLDSVGRVPEFALLVSLAASASRLCCCCNLAQRASTLDASGAFAVPMKSRQVLWLWQDKKQKDSASRLTLGDSASACCDMYSMSTVQSHSVANDKLDHEVQMSSISTSGEDSMVYCIAACTSALLPHADAASLPDSWA